MRYRPAIILYLIVLTNFSPSVAGPVFTWVDQEGVTHFSESPPADTSIQPRQLDVLPPTDAGSAVVDDYYSIANQAERMEARRLERLEAAAARLRAQADAIRAATEAQAAKQAADNDNTGSIQYYPLPAYPYYRGHQRRPHRRNPHYRAHTGQPEPAPPPRRLNKPIRTTR